MPNPILSGLQDPSQTPAGPQTAPQDADIQPAASETPEAPGAAKGASKDPVALLKSVFPNLPDDVLKIPLVQWLTMGKPAAVRIPPGHYYPDLKPVQTHLPALVDNGFNVYKAQSTGDVVLFNPLYMPPTELQAIDQKGKIDQMIPDYGTLTGQAPKEMTDEEAQQQVTDGENTHRELMAKGYSASPVSVPAPVSPTAQVSGPPPAPAVLRGIAKARLASLNPGAPTSGPAPGQGRILNGLLTPTV